MIAVDTHVHIYNDHSVDAALDSAFANLPTNPKVICLTERADCDSFKRLSEIGSLTEERNSLMIKRGTEKLFVIAGRQINTLEKLEVSALGVLEIIPDGEPITITMSKIHQLGGVPVFPWGFGKWWFNRGDILSKLLESLDPSSILLGDSRLRPGRCTTPAIMRRFSEAGFRILYGSDPLPLIGEERAPGSFYTLLEGNIDQSRPFSSLKQLFLNAPITPGGHRASLYDVISANLRIRFLSQGK